MRGHGRGLPVLAAHPLLQPGHRLLRRGVGAAGPAPRPQLPLPGTGLRHEPGRLRLRARLGHLPHALPLRLADPEPGLWERAALPEPLRRGGAHLPGLPQSEQRGVGRVRAQDGGVEEQEPASARGLPAQHQHRRPETVRPSHRLRLAGALLRPGPGATARELAPDQPAPAGQLRAPGARGRPGRRRVDPVALHQLPGPHQAAGPHDAGPQVPAARGRLPLPRHLHRLPARAGGVLQPPLVHRRSARAGAPAARPGGPDAGGAGRRQPLHEGAHGLGQAAGGDRRPTGAPPRPVRPAGLRPGLARAPLGDPAAHDPGSAGDGS